MIVKPQDMGFGDKTFSAILYGAPGVGKTTLACSAEAPLLIDLDKGVSRVRAQHRVCTSMVNTYEELLADLTENSLADFKTIIVDTGGALVTMLKDYVMRKDPARNSTRGGEISQKGFGAVKQEFVGFTNRIKTVLNKNVIYVFHSEEQKDKDGNPIQRLLCEGSAKNIVWQPCDFGGYLFMNGDRRMIAFSPTNEYFAKGCYGIGGVREIPVLGAANRNDYMTRLFAEARENIAAESAYFAEEKRKYDAALAAGLALVEGIADVDGLNAAITAYKTIAHALTSEIEIKHRIAERAKRLGAKWDRAAGAYAGEERMKAGNDEAQNHADATR